MSNDLPPELLIRFDDTDLASAGRHAQALRELLLDNAPGVTPTLERSATDTMDLGSALRVGVPPSAVAPAARSIAAYMAREQPGSLVIEHGGRVLYRGDTADTARIAVALSERAHRGG